MQTALKIQAIAAPVKVSIFLEPKLNVMRILKGKPSECDSVAYWRYQQSQTYRSVRQLLTRWDFDGAKTLLEAWNQISEGLLNSQVKDKQQTLERHQRQVQQVLAGMQIAVDCLNLDMEAAQVFNPTDQLPFQAALDDDGLLLKNLYAQCQIYYELNQVANFLPRMGSFYEAAQNQLIKNLKGEQYFKPKEPKESKETDRGSELLTGKFAQEHPHAWQPFLQVHRQCIQAKEDQGWTYDRFDPDRRWDHSKPLRLGNRYIRQSFIKALIVAFYGNRYTPNKPKPETWERLDFWYDRRNDIAHSAEGVSVAWVKALALKKPTCAYDEILPVMAQIMQMLELKVVEGEVFLYGSIRGWSIAQLRFEH